MNKLAKLVDGLSYEELKLLKKDLSEGNIERLISSKIKNLEEGAETICPVCHAGIPDPNNGGFTLFFGQKDFRRKATFCATDCLDYFVQNLKTISSKRLREEEKDGAFRDNKDI